MVAIKDMEIPNCCASCPFNVLSKCLLTRQFIKGGRLVNGEDKRLDDCPLVELEERKVGKWVFTKTIFDKYGCTAECPSCHKKWKTYDEIRFEKENKFCPNCGNRNGRC